MENRLKTLRRSFNKIKKIRSTTEWFAYVEDHYIKTVYVCPEEIDKIANGKICPIIIEKASSSLDERAKSTKGRKIKELWKMPYYNEELLQKYKEDEEF